MFQKQHNSLVLDGRLQWAHAVGMQLQLGTTSSSFGSAEQSKMLVERGGIEELEVDDGRHPSDVFITTHPL